MKKTFLLAAAMIIAALGSQAKAADLAVGAGFNYATKFDQAGLGFKVQVGLSGNWRIQPEIIYFFQNRDVSTFQINCDAHYAINIAPKLNVYPLAGVSFSSWSVDHSESNATTRFGVNLGAGLEYRVASRLDIFVEERGQITSDYSQSLATLGVKYHF